jgi:hypothetical protein
MSGGDTVKKEVRKEILEEQRADENRPFLFQCDKDRNPVIISEKPDKMAGPNFLWENYFSSTDQ